MITAAAAAQEAPTFSQQPSAPVQSVQPASPAEPEPAAPPPAALPPAAQYDSAIFLKPMPADQLDFIRQFSGAASGELYHDKQFRRVMKSFVPDCMFHYGRDMPLTDALDAVIKDSRIPVRVRDGRYVTVSGLGGSYLAGRGFLWLDLKTGIGLGGFYFHPTNGEPTPSLVVFSRQVKEDQMSYGALPQEFIRDMAEWTAESRVQFLQTNYFISGANKRILLEHDEDYCSPADGSVAPGAADCEQINADAADLDVTAAYYLDQVHYATNGTAWMIGPDQVAWVNMRDRTCGGVVDPLGCRIRVTRERVRVIAGRAGGRR